MADEPLVVVIHGALRSRVGLWPVVWSLRRRGLQARAFGYATRRDPLAVHGERLATAIERWRQKRGDDLERPLPLLCLLTHSMGGLVARTYLASSAAARQSQRQRVWMFAPPNQGSYVADKLRDLKLFHWVYGAAAKELLPERVRELGSVPKSAEVRIVAGGSLSGDRGLHGWIPGNHDGLVRVDETGFEGHQPELVGGSHSTMQWRPELLAAAAAFFSADVPTP